MTGAAVAFPIAFLVVTAILLWNLIYARGRWLQKLLLIITVPYISLVLWLSLDGYLGWPTPENLPQKSLLVWSLVAEPPPGKEGGKIYLWLTPIPQNKTSRFIEKYFGYKNQEKEPRAYVLPYTRKMHEKLDKAMGMLREGKSVVMGRGTENDLGKEGAPDQNSETNPSQENSGDDEEVFYELPPPKLPEKD